MLRAAQLAVARDLRFDVVVLPGSSDPADLLASEGVEAMRARISRGVPVATFRVQRVLATADLESTDGRNRAYAALRNVLGAMEPSPEREDLVRLAASRLGLSEQLAGLLTVPVSPGAGAEAAGDGAPERARLDPREEEEQTFLAMCIALPERGRDALRRVDLDAHFTTARLRRAAAHLRDHIAAPIEGLAEADADLAPLMAELTLRAAREPADAQALDLQALQLEKRRIEREIAAASAEGRPEVSVLAAEKQRVQARIDSAMAER
jgi:DNA primase